MKIDWIFMFALKEHEQIYTHTINGIRTETSTNFALSRKYRFFFLFFSFLSHFLSCNHFFLFFLKIFFMVYFVFFCLFYFVCAGIVVTVVCVRACSFSLFFSFFCFVVYRKSLDGAECIWYTG